VRLRRIVCHLTVALLITSVFAACSYGMVFNRFYEYYSDAGFTCLVGENFIVGTHCPDDEGWLWGNEGSFRRLTTLYECGTGSGGSSICAEYYGGAWHTITCP
jgi:hypothetical protein